MSLRRLIPPAALVAAIAAAMIAAPASHGLAASKTPKFFDAPAQRGERIAGLECARCHAIDLKSDSPNPSAPPFRDIRRRYNGASLAREFTTIGQVGHYQMPPTQISRSEGEDLIAFIEDLVP